MFGELKQVSGFYLGMPGILEFEIELSRKEVIAAAERKLLRPLSTNERAVIQQIDSLLRLESFCRAFNSAAYTPTEVRKDLERIVKRSMQDGDCI